MSVCACLSVSVCMSVSACVCLSVCVNEFMFLCASAHPSPSFPSSLLFPSSPFPPLHFPLSPSPLPSVPLSAGMTADEIAAVHSSFVHTIDLYGSRHSLERTADETPITYRFRLEETWMDAQGKGIRVDIVLH